MGNPQDGNENKKMEQREESEECSIAASWIELASFIISYMRLSLPPFNSGTACHFLLPFIQLLHCTSSV